MMEPYTELMVNKGVNISNECAAKRIYVAVMLWTRKTRIQLDATFRSLKNK